MRVLKRRRLTGVGKMIYAFAPTEPHASEGKRPRRDTGQNHKSNFGRGRGEFRHQVQTSFINAAPGVVLRAFPGATQGF